MSNSLVKLLDNSIIPAAVMVLSKLLGIILVSNFFGIAWSLREYANSMFATSTVLNPDDVIIVTSYSDLFMYIVLATFFSLAVFRSIFFHNTHVTEMVVLSLSKFNMLNLIKDSATVYSKAGGWWIFMVFTNLLIWLNYFSDRTYLWVAIVTTLATVVLSTILLIDIYREISLIKKHPSKYNWN